MKIGNRLQYGFSRQLGVRRFFDLSVLFLILVITSNPYFFHALGKEVWIVLPVVVAVVWGKYRCVRFRLSDLVIFAAIFVVLLAHLLDFGSATIMSSLRMLSRVFVALVIARAVSDFPEKYFRIMVVLSIISCLFYFSSILGVGLEGLFRPIGIPLDDYGGIHIGIHHYKREYTGGVLRNSGIFGEPGIFAGFLILALIFSLNARARPPVGHYFVVIVALLSTQSTTGYLVGFLVVLWLVVGSSRVGAAGTMKLRWALGIAFVPIAFAGFAVAFGALPFLSDKIWAQIDVVESEGHHWQLTRYGNAVFDLGYIAERPAFGWSQLLGTRGLEGEEFAYLGGNGLTGFAVSYGLVSIGGFFWFAFKGLTCYFGDKRRALIAILVIGVLLNGEHFLMYPVFLAVMFLRGSKSGKTGLAVQEVKSVFHGRPAQPSIRSG